MRRRPPPGPSVAARPASGIGGDVVRCDDLRCPLTLDRGFWLEVGQAEGLRHGLPALLGQARGDVDVERRHLVEARQSEPLEELEACPVQERAARRVRTPEFDDEAAVQQRADGVVGIDPTDPLDRRTRDRLAVRDDRQRLEAGGRQPDRVGADVARDERAGFRRTRELDPVAVDDQPNPALTEAHLEVTETRVDRLAVDTGERRDLAPRKRSFGDEQQAFERGLGELQRRTVVGGDGGPVPRVVLLPQLDLQLVGHANDSSVSSNGASSARASVARATMAPHGSACSTTISRRFINSSMARNVTATTTRSRTPRSRSWSTTSGASRRAARMIRARSVSVTVLGRISGGGSGGGAITARCESAVTSTDGSSGAMSAGRAPARPDARAAPASRRNRPIRSIASSASRRPASRCARYSRSRARSSASGSGTSSPSATFPVTAGGRGSIARLLMRISCEAIATNALTFPSRSAS